MPEDYGAEINWGGALVTQWLFQVLSTGSLEAKSLMESQLDRDGTSASLWLGKPKWSVFIFPQFIIL